MTTPRQPTARLALTSLMLAVLAACSSTPPAAPAAPATTPVAAAPAPAAPAAPVARPAPAPVPAPAADTRAAAASNASAKALPAHLDPNSDISRGRSVYFDFDSTAVKSDATPLIQSHGKYLAANPTLAIRIEGNADERGSTEYNLALGNKRAESVRQALKLIGAKDGQMEAISYGELRPKATGHDEAAWSQNRRADLQYPAK